MLSAESCWARTATQSLSLNPTRAESAWRSRMSRCASPLSSPSICCSVAEVSAGSTRGSSAGSQCMKSRTRNAPPR